MPLKISRILHAGYVFECDGATIAFDTIFENPFSRNCHAFPAVRFDQAQIEQLRFDAVFISHFHDDHCSLESLNLLDRLTPIYLYCIFDELFAMISALGFAHVHRLSIDTPVRVASFEVIPRKALDADVDSMFQVRAAGLNVLNVVDAWFDPEILPELMQYAPWDMVLWPFQTMREMAVIAPSRAVRGPVELPEEWAGQLRALNPRYLVPSSCQFVQEPWSWYNHAMFPITYRRFQDEMKTLLPDATILRLNPGVSVTLDGASLTPAAPLSWVIPVGDQDIDFAYDPTLQPPGTTDIARHFPALTAAQTAVAMDFFQAGLIEKYQDMELPEDSYFQQPRLWQLAVYDHAGAATQFHYRIHGDRIEALPGGAEPLSWCTEIPIAKCYAALELGESLTSMYMRINDYVFDAATETDLASADLVDDPLIRCLFNDSVAAYQAAQLKRIKARAAAS